MHDARSKLTFTNEMFLQKSYLMSKKAGNVMLVVCMLLNIQLKSDSSYSHTGLSHFVNSRVMPSSLYLHCE